MQSDTSPSHSSEIIALSSPRSAVHGAPTKVEDKPVNPPPITFPDGGIRAWSNIAGCFLLSFTSYGQLNAFGVFQTYYSQTLLHGHSVSTIAWIGSTQLTISYVAGCILGRMFDIYGSRVLLVSGCLLSTFSLMMTSLATKYYQILLAQGFGLGIGIALQFYPILAVPSHWFCANRAAAIGIVIAGSSLSGIIYPIMLSRLFVSVGFPWAVRIVAFMNFGCQVLAIPFVKERFPPRLGIPLVDWQAFRETTFLLHALGGFFVAFALYTPYWYIELFSLQKGVGANLSFYMIAIMNAAGLVGRVVTGYAADKYGRFNTLAPVTLLGGISVLAIWATSWHTAEIVVFVLIFGFTSASYSSLASTATAQVTSDPSRIGARTGMFMTAMSPGILTGPSIAGAIVDASNGGYLGLQIFVGVFLVAGAALALAARWNGARSLVAVF
ncbi:Aspyridones efflux protein [Sparassis crispa]|uniref:Aspyridones efflux protein n=1 Tax=Sparassis crispa TaxID=139825 RepID=A0A401G9V3_9APHY|nr:Aspyridones efflux protein [Sparassis crispa]GBE78966.1 Aspyridones efflux protein [Sparassis crispa]